jgi:hypothetical protein
LLSPWFSSLHILLVFEFMEIRSVYAAIAAFAGALVALVVYHCAVIAPAMAKLSRLVATHDELIGGGAGAAGRLASAEAGLAAQRDELERAAGRISELEGLARADLSQVGFVRYDAFEDTGSDLSYALALLNREGDGVVISSIYSRTDTRTYGKAVRGFKPAVNASEEELRAIERARSAEA